MDSKTLDRLNTLMKGWYENQLTEVEEQEFFGLVNRAGNEFELSGSLKEVWEQVKEEPIYSRKRQEALVRHIIKPAPAKIFNLRRIAAAAVFIILTGAAFFLLLRNKDSQSQHAQQQIIPKASGPEDIPAPDANRATLTLSDGRKLVLDSAGKGMLVQEGDISVLKSQEGELVYSGKGDEIKYHTLTVPRGSKPFRLTLPDGTLVNVNVASSITYPTAFSEADRVVTITGEAFFDVKHRSAPESHSQSFIVKVNGMKVKVLGTRFNVNAYEDEGSVKTTLLEGSVNISTGKDQQVLLPNEQAVVSNQDKKIRLVKNADVDEAMAWINGKFRFADAGVEAVMRQVSRWYDVDVVYSAKPALHFGGQIDRNSTLRQMLTILETSGLHFRISDNKVIILP